jgi:hypothetical protein
MMGKDEMQASGKVYSSFPEVRTKTPVFSRHFPAGISTVEHRVATSGFEAETFLIFTCRQ